MTRRRTHGGRRAGAGRPAATEPSPRDLEVLIAYEAGAPLAELAAQLGVSRPRVRQIAVRAARLLGREPGRRQRPPLTARERRAIAEARERGDTYAEIAAEHDVSRMSVWRVAAAAGLVER